MSITADTRYTYEWKVIIETGKHYTWSFVETLTVSFCEWKMTDHVIYGRAKCQITHLD